MKKRKVQGSKLKVKSFFKKLFTVHCSLFTVFFLFTVVDADASEKAKKYPNWYEMHIKQGIIKEDGSGAAQGVAGDAIMRAIQARRVDGLNPQVCVGCHSKGGPGTWLYGNPKYMQVKWTPAKKYKKTAADRVEVKRPYISGIKVSEDQ